MATAFSQPPTNTPDAVATTVTAELEDRIMSVLPKELADWIRYEATGDCCAAEIFKAWHSGIRPDRILAHLRGEQRKDTRRTYGPSHPQASLI